MTVVDTSLVYVFVNKTLLAVQRTKGSIRYFFCVLSEICMTCVYSQASVGI